MKQIGIQNVSVSTFIRHIGNTHIAIIAVTVEYCFACEDEIEIIEITWHYVSRTTSVTHLGAW